MITGEYIVFIVGDELGHEVWIIYLTKKETENESILVCFSDCYVFDVPSIE